ncbi:MAG: nitronate monooxygenase family protein [Helicobacteraceae bacterium]|nr:nitronate monooxygenase family protein [Helicobacteraceae bacterium]
MEFKEIKIGRHTLKYPIIQGGMGVGISWSRLAGAVSLAGALGVISAIGTGYYDNRSFVSKQQFGRPSDTEQFYNREATFQIFKDARKICGDRPLGANILFAINDYPRVFRDCCEAGADAIITGAGLPMNMPEYAQDFPNVALIPIISSPKALRLIAKRWEQRYKRVPDAVVLEGPLSGGHQGFTYEQCLDPNYQLENLVKPVVQEAQRIDKNIPVFAAGGIWTRDDIVKFMELGASGVQMGTRFIGTYECDAPQAFKDLLIGCKESDIELLQSPVGYPARGVRTKLIELVDKRLGPPIRCVSNCVVPCRRGIEAKAVGYCIADRLSDAAEGNVETGLFFTGSNGYRIDRLISVNDLIKKLVYGENC